MVKTVKMAKTIKEFEKHHKTWLKSLYPQKNFRSRWESNPEALARDAA